MHLLGQKNVPIYQLGVRALCQEEADRRKEYNVGYKDASELVRGKISSVSLPEDFPEKVYISFDLDGLGSGDYGCDGYACSRRAGVLSGADLLASAVEGRKIIGADIVELAPHPAHTHCDFTAALVSYAIMGLAANSCK